MVKFFIKFALKMKIPLILDKKFHFLGTFVADFGRPKGPSTNFGKMKKIVSFRADSLAAQAPEFGILR